MTMEGSDNLVLTFFSWWYGEATAKLFVFLKFFGLYLADLFSVKTCLKTLFSPWKRDQILIKGLSLQDQFQTMLLNFSSRFVGFAVKMAVVLIFTLILIVFIIFCLAFVLIWLLWPILALISIYFGVVNR